MSTFAARYEFKYLITEAQADWAGKVADFYCEKDRFGDDGVYEVSSLYFDTVDWLTALATVEGVRERFKVRIRTYGFEDKDPVFLEDKSRVGTTILKRRAMVERDFAHPICTGLVPKSVAEDCKDPISVAHFRNLVDELDMRPKLWVRYQREAWASAYGDNARMTFDRYLEVQLPGDVRPFEPTKENWTTVPLNGPPTILELKFSGAAPGWMFRIIHGLQIQRVSCSKYVQGVEQLIEQPWAETDGGRPWTIC
jgi:hypothetical protein